MSERRLLLVSILCFGIVAGACYWVGYVSGRYDAQIECICPSE